MTAILQDLADHRVMLFAPHPDDEALGAGALLCRGAQMGAAVEVVFATNGDNNPWVQRIGEKRFRLTAEDKKRFGHKRQKEAVSALGALGIDSRGAKFLGWPDQGLTAQLNNKQQASVQRLADLIEAFEPTLLIVPSAFDVHPDHSALAVMVRLALEKRTVGLPVQLLSYFAHPPKQPPKFSEVLSLSPSELEQSAKSAALDCHRTQKVCHRRLFEGAAHSVETYFVNEQINNPCLKTGRFSVKTAWGRQQLWVDLKIPSRLWSRAGQKLTLELLGIADGQVCLGRSYIDLNWAQGQVPIYSCAGQQIVGYAETGRHQSGCFVRLPRDLVGSSQQVLIKLRRRGRFFDQSGWQSILPVAAIKKSASLPRVCAIIPCYNIAGLCGQVVRQASEFADHVIAIDDGSTDDTAGQLAIAAQNNRQDITMISLEQNKGKGAALLAGFRRGLSMDHMQIFVTLDGDGQHRPGDIPKLAAACQDGAEFTIGCRLGPSKVPLRSRIGNSVTSTIMRTFLPACPVDTQSGFRAFDRGFLEYAIDQLSPGRYETEVQMLMLALQDCRRVDSVAIPRLYFDGNSSSHFRPLADSISIYGRMLQYLKHTPVSQDYSKNDFSSLKASNDGQGMEKRQEV